MVYKIACVIVTFNRKELLRRCLNAILSQESKPHSVFLIDNASTDGTLEYIKEHGFYNVCNEGVNFNYNRLVENIGGAGGFYTGIKQAHESNEKFDGFWIMDDDGIPDKMQLFNLLRYFNQYDYLSPYVLSIENPEQPAFISLDLLHRTHKDSDGNYIGLANPFNGVLYSRHLVDTIGYPKKEMFIWGDELNYEYRAMNAGFIPRLITSAIHYHPYNRQIKLSTAFGRKIAVPNEDWKLYCLIRNRVYNSKIKRNTSALIRRVIAEFIDYTSYFILHFCYSRIKVLMTAIYDGLNEDFRVSRKYI